MSGDLVRLAILGHPLHHTRSPQLHRAGLDALGLRGESHALPTTPAELGARLATLAEEGFTGVNLTHPLKEEALAHVTRVAEGARVSRSVNTIGFSGDGAWGDTTDGPGFVDFLRSLGRDPARERTVFLGAGGAARSLALALTAAGAERVAASTRTPERADESWRGLPGSRLVGWRTPAEADALRDASLVINATPIADAEGAVPVERLPRHALVVDLVYGETITPWVVRARSAGLEAYDGLGLLVFQARRSLALWLARPVPLDPLARAVGWPR